MRAFKRRDGSKQLIRTLQATLSVRSGKLPFLMGPDREGVLPHFHCSFDAGFEAGYRNWPMLAHGYTSRVHIEAFHAGYRRGEREAEAAISKLLGGKEGVQDAA